MQHSLPILSLSLLTVALMACGGGGGSSQASADNNQAVTEPTTDTTTNNTDPDPDSNPSPTDSDQSSGNHSSIGEVQFDTRLINTQGLPELPFTPQIISQGQTEIMPVTEVETYLYVSPEGSDSNPGTLEQPFQTFARARDAVRSHLDGQGHIMVYFREGEYVFSDTQVLSLADSGSSNQVVTYASYPGESAVFSSLQPLGNWQAQGHGIYRAPLPEGIGHVRFLWDKQQDWLPRSATEMFITPEESDVDGGCLECNWDTYEAQPARMNVQYPDDFAEPDWRYSAQYDLRQSTISWVQEILPIRTVNEDQARIYTSIPASLEMRLNFEEAENLNRNWVLNSLEGLDEPGEWASLNGYIYYYPAYGAPEEVAVPTLTELIRIDNGQSDGNAPITQPVSHIRFDGITFTGGDFYTMNNQDITAQHDWSVVDAATALLRVRNAKNIVVQNCHFLKSGSTGLRFDRYAQNNIVRHNQFHHLGREAILLSGRGPGYGDVNHSNDISYNQISATGSEKWTAPAIVLDQSSNNRVHHNHIEDTEFTAIALTAPRQLAFLSLYENEGPSEDYLGREFHYFDISPSVVTQMLQESSEGAGSYKGMSFTYNYDNYVELNTLIDVGQGAGYLVNGYVYNSAVKPGESNFINYNYVHDTRNNQVNNAAFYSDSDQDYTTYIGNMISGMKNNDFSFEPLPIFLLHAYWAETDTNNGIRIPAFANAIIDSKYPALADSEYATLDGSITDQSAGDSKWYPVYSAMLNILENELYSPDAIPGQAAMAERLRSVLK